MNLRSRIQILHDILGAVLLPRTALFCASVLIFLACMLQLLIPWFIHLIVDKCLIPKDPNHLRALCSLLACLAITSFVAGIGERHLFRHIGFSARAQLKRNLLSHVFALPPQTQRTYHSGSITTLFNHDLTIACRFYEVILREVLYSTCRLISVVAVVLYIFHWVGLCSLAVIPLFWILSRPFSKRTRQAAKRMHIATERLTKLFYEIMSALREIKLFGSETFILQTYQDNLAQTDKAELTYRMLQEGASLTYVAFWVIVAGIYYIVGTAYIRGHFTIGLITALVSYTLFLQEPFARLLGIFTELPSIETSWQQLAHLLELEHDFDTGPMLVPKPPVGIEVDDIVFAYEGAQRKAITNICLGISSGKTIGIVGRSGSGKSTLVSLLVGLSRPEGGVVRFNGRDLRELSRKWLREKVAVAFHDPFLFEGTIADNLTLGQTYEHQDLEWAVKLSCLDEFIAELSQGMNAPVGERGIQLSAGQRQRIGIARALLRRPEVLIFDEATSGLDHITERRLYENIRYALGKSTFILISHRVQSIEFADSVAVLEMGSLVAVGSPADLQDHCSLYRELHSQGLTLGDSEREESAVAG